jgi:SAM-dependent methyltransferase
MSNMMNATYSPEDNKLRLYPDQRLDNETYRRVRKAGFSWAPMQKLFVAPMWTPDREDLLIELCGEIEDEDKSLAERSEERAERFEEYSDKRGQEADRTKEQVEQIAGGIPLGQPILVGHHSERHARKCAERIKSGMTKAVNLWKTAQYWKARAAGALRNAKYRELPAVRHRRIKKLKSEINKQLKTKNQEQLKIDLWSKDGLTKERARVLSNLPGNYEIWSSLDKEQITPETARDQTLEMARRNIEWADRWLEHLNHRLTYEQAMLDEAGGIRADKFDLEIGGKVLVSQGWVTILKINKSNGAVSSVTTNAKYVPVRSIEEIQDYESPSAEAANLVKAATKLAPLCNYDGEGFISMTKEQWAKSYRDNKGSKEIPPNEKHGRHRLRYRYGFNKSGFVFLTDDKIKEAPPPKAFDGKPKPEELPRTPVISDRPRQLKTKTEREQGFENLEESLRRGGGVDVVSSPQLFPTPAELARQVVDMADIRPGQEVLEPSAGTGRLLEPLYNSEGTECLCEPKGRLVAVEVNQKLAALLTRTYVNADVYCADFLEENGRLGKFDRIIMNPPFVNGSDIKHIEHARSFLKPGGRLVAICANGPRQQEKLKPAAVEWHDLPQGSFAPSGTNVNAAIVVFESSE